MRRITLLLLMLLLASCASPLSTGKPQRPAEPPGAPASAHGQPDTPGPSHGQPDAPGPSHGEPYTPAPSPPEEPTVRLAFVGDVLLGASLAAMAGRSGGDYPWQYVAPLLQEADLAIGNLETAVTTGGKAESNKQFTFRSHPSTLVGAARAGVDILSLANNHSRDYGAEALLESIRHLREASIHPVGAGADLEEAIRPVMVEKHGLRLAFLAFSRVIPETHWVAWEGNPGVAPGWDPKVVSQAVEKAGEEADLVVVLIHWGEERADEPRPTDVDLARLLRKSGADLIIGHHPHVLQGIDYADGQLTAYSLGNFIFTTPRPLTDQTGILQVTLTRSGVTGARLTPFVIVGGQPRPAKPDQARQILNRLDQLSRPWKTRLDNEGRVIPPSGRPQPSRVQ